MKTIKNARVLLLVLAAACSSSTSNNGGGGPPPTTCTFKNPLTSGQDPWVVKSGGFYYLIESTNNQITIYKSTSLTMPKQSVGATVFSAPAGSWNETNIWAPELHHINGLWYIYYAGGRKHADGSDAPFTSQRAGVLQSTVDDPLGPYVDKGMLYTGDNTNLLAGTEKWAIDLTVGTINGQLYAVWSGWDQDATTDRTQQNLYIARMSNPTTIATNRVKIAAPDQSWESGPELPLEEGPEFLEHAGQQFIIYSANDSWLPTYQLGQLKLTSSTADPLNPASFVKSGPVFSGTNDVHGVGHSSFTKSPDDTEDWIVYHTKVSTAPGWERDIRTQKFTWNADGSPHFGTPVPTGESVQAPSGQCK